MQFVVTAAATLCLQGSIHRRVPAALGPCHQDTTSYPKSTFVDDASIRRLGAVLRCMRYCSGHCP